MENTVSRIESGIRQLRTALSRGDEDLVDLHLQQFQRDLLNEGTYLSIWDERLLAQASRLLHLCCGEELRDERIEELDQHLSIVRAVHDKLYAILDYKVGIDDLLFLHLNEWPQLDQVIGCSFDDAAKKTLEEARRNGTTDQRIESFITTYFRYLKESGLGEAVGVLKPPVEQALGGYRRTLGRTAYGLFATKEMGEVYGLRIRAITQGTGQIQAISSIHPDMDKAARSAVACTIRLCPSIKQYDFQWDIDRDDVAFTGSSIGLALTLGILNEIERLNIDAYTAFTGHVEWDTGNVRRIERLNEKLASARELGIRRAFIPRENVGEVNDIEEIEIVAVGSVEEALNWLQNQSHVQIDTPPEQLAYIKIRELEIELKAQGIQLGKLEQRDDYCKRAEFTDHRERLFVDVFHGKKGLTPQVLGKNTRLKQTVQKAVDRIFGSKPQGGQDLSKRLRSRYIVTNPIDQQKVQSYISERNDCILESEKNCVYRAKLVKTGQTVFVRQFLNGTLTVDGPTGSLFEEIDGTIQAILNAPGASGEHDERNARLRSQVEEVEAVRLGEKWIGTDESGKGDYYGPLVGAAVLVDERTAKLLEELGVKDSKKLSDNRVHELAARIHQVCGKRAAVVVIPPERYNTLYEQFRVEDKNLNTLLAWAHTRALENILSEFPQQQITVLVDKFADESYIQDKLLEKGRQTDLNLVQLPKAEANIAVAAASVLARAQFLQWIERLSKQYGVDLPKGASDPRVVQVGKQIVARFGESGLAKVAKLHFKTTKKILA